MNLNTYRRITDQELVELVAGMDQAIKVLEAAGCSRARQYYDRVVGECDRQYAADLKEAAHWYAQQLNERTERQVIRTRVGRDRTKYQFAGFPENR